ncbi:MAG: hypothetical protein H6706_16990 [Myxococcales bacterium]|nr:hypothetical protein [Myxococcales bacterium]
MLAALLVLLAEGPFAVFWSGPATYVVDAGAGRMYTAPGWYASDEAGRVWRYRLRVDAFRHDRGLEGEVWPASRWTVLEQVKVGDKTFRPLTPVPSAPPPGAGHLQDEHTVAQFRGDAATVLERLRTYGPEGPRTVVAARTLALPDGRAEEPPRGSTEALEWLSRALPDAVDACLRQPAGLLAWEEPGGEEVRRLALGPTGEACAEDLATLPLGTVVGSGGGLAWWREAGDARLTDVVDARPELDQGVALLLRGPPLGGGLAGEACAPRTVHLWKPQGPTVPLGDADRLDGLRWLAPGDPLVRHVRSRFRPIGEVGPCTAPMRLLGQATRPGEPDAQLCRIDEEGRAWGGLSDLAASATVAAERGTLYIRIRVEDPERDPGDGVQLWLGGDGGRAVSFRVEGDRISAEGKRAERTRLEGMIIGETKETTGGYEISLRTPLELAGRTPAVAIRVDDVDPGVPGRLGLWVGGHRVTGQNRRPSPCEVR